MQADNLTEHQKIIAVQLPGELHHLSIVTIRQLAAGYQYQGDAAKMIAILATAIKDLIDG